MMDCNETDAALQEELSESERFAKSRRRRRAFLTPEEQEWYDGMIEKYREEFGLRACEN